MHGNSVSVDQAVTSVERLTGVVNQVLQLNQDLCSRLATLESRPGYQSTRFAASMQEEGEEDDASTIRSRRHANHSVIERDEIGIMRSTFELDLRKSRVYKRTMRRMSCESIQTSAAPSFGWSCLSEMSLAAVSNISVISLPIAAKELSNGEHYIPTLIASKELDTTTHGFIGIPARPPSSPLISPRRKQHTEIARRIVVLG